MRRRWALARSCSLTPTRKATSRSAMMMRSVVSMNSLGAARRSFASGPGPACGDGFQQDSSRLVERKLEGFRRCQPAELLRFLVEPHVGRARATAGVVQQNEMFITMEFSRMDAVL